MQNSDKRTAETVSSPTAEQKAPKLRWCQWRLRSLFILTLLVAIGMSWLAVTIQNQRKQKAAVDAIEKKGGVAQCQQTWLGRLLRDDSLVSVTVVSFSAIQADFSELEATDEWLDPLKVLSELKGLELDRSKVTDAGLAILEGFRQLEWLELCDTQITDAGLVHVKGLTQLQSLRLTDVRVTDAGLKNLEGLKQLQLLELGDTQITDAGLVHLAGLAQLKELWLTNTPITDAGLVHLQGLSELRLLQVDRTNVTRQGIAKLRQALPKCKVYYWKQGHSKQKERT